LADKTSGHSPSFPARTQKGRRVPEQASPAVARGGLGSFDADTRGDRNLMNNLPAGLIAGSAVHSVHVPETTRRAILIGADVGGRPQGLKLE